MKRLTASCLSGVALMATATASATVRSTPDLPLNQVTCSDLQPSNSPLGVPLSLRAGVTYAATTFPIPIRITLPDSTWSGGQWKTGSTGCHNENGGLGRAPFYGWVGVGHGSDPTHRRGSIVIMSSYAKTPSVAAVVALMLRSPQGVTFEQPVSTKVGDVAGRQLDGQVDASHHQFFAFTKAGAAAGAHVDGVDMAQGAHFRVLVFDAHGRTVVIYIESGTLSATAFASFLKSAEGVLATLRFPTT